MSEYLTTATDGVHLSIDQAKTLQLNPKGSKNGKILVYRAFFDVLWGAKFAIDHFSDTLAEVTLAIIRRRQIES